MKKILIVILLIICNTSFGQAKGHKMALPEFLIAMFDDYNGYEIIMKHPVKSKFVTSFNSSEMKLAEIFIDSLTAYNSDKKYKFEVKNSNDDIEIYSDKYSDLFRTYYTFEKIPNKGYTDFENKNLQYDIYLGKLNAEKFKTDDQKLSYLMGTLLKYGNINRDNNFEFNFSNSLSHFQLTKKFLNDLGIKIIKTETRTYYTMPGAQIIIIKPNKKLKILFKNLMKDNQKNNL